MYIEEAKVVLCILKNKRSNVEFACKGDLRPLLQWSPSLSHFHKKIFHPKQYSTHHFNVLFHRSLHVFT